MTAVQIAQLLLAAGVELAPIVERLVEYIRQPHGPGRPDVTDEQIDFALKLVETLQEKIDAATASAATAASDDGWRSR